MQKDQIAAVMWRMAEDKTPNVPLEIIIRLDHRPAMRGLGVAASATWRVVSSKAALWCYVAVAALALLIGAAAAAPTALGRVLAVALISGLGGGIIALKRRYSPLLPPD